MESEGEAVKFYTCKKEYSTLLEAIITGDDSKVCSAFLAIGSLKEQATKCFEKEIRGEVKQLCGRSFVSNFHASNPSDLKSFSYGEQERELIQYCPILYKMVTAAAIKEQNIKRNKIKSLDTIKRSIMTGVSIILNARNNNLNIHQMYTSMILYRGGANKITFRRLAARGLCLCYFTTLKNQNKLAKNYDKKLLQRKQKVEGDYKSISNNQESTHNGSPNTTNATIDVPEELPDSTLNMQEVAANETATEDILAGDPAIASNTCNTEILQQHMQIYEEITIGEKNINSTSFVLDDDQTDDIPFDANGIGFRFVGDNVNVRTSSRHMRKGREVTQFDLFNIIAVENRVPFEDVSDCKQLITQIPAHLASKQLCNFVPDANDNHALREDFKYLIGNTIRKYMPACEWLVEHIPSHRDHQYTKYTATKSKKVYLEKSKGQKSTQLIKSLPLFWPYLTIV